MAMTRAGQRNRARAGWVERLEPTKKVTRCAKTTSEAPFGSVCGTRPCLNAMVKNFRQTDPCGGAARYSPRSATRYLRHSRRNCTPVKSWRTLLPWLMRRSCAATGHHAVYRPAVRGANAAFLTPYAVNTLQQKNPGANSGEMDALIKALGLVGPAAYDAVPVLIDKLGEPYYSSTRLAAAEALGKIGPGAAAAVPALLKILSGAQDETLRYTAVIALGNLGPAARSVPAL